MTNTKIRLAIIGGGLAGATLANALIDIPHLIVHVFEAAPEFSERGAAVGLPTNALLALEKTVRSSTKVLEDAGGISIASTRMMIGSGPKAGSVLMDFGDVKEDEELIVHRDSLLRELLAPLPNDILHPSKKLIGIDGTGEAIGISFTDGTSNEFDVVIGADGVFSLVRDHVLQDRQKAFAATPGGFWDCRILVPFDKAKATLGKELFELHRQYCWFGEIAFIMHDVLENGTLVQCVISAVEREAPKDRRHVLTRESLTETLKDGKEVQSRMELSIAIHQLVLEKGNVQGYSQWEHKTTPTFARGRVCIMVDAAHATTPWQGAGAGQAFEDAMVLAGLLRQVTSIKGVESALQAYSTVRMLRCQQVIDSSRSTGQIFCGQYPDDGLDPEKLKEALAPRWNFLVLDHEVHVQEALNEMERLKTAVHKAALS